VCVCDELEPNCVSIDNISVLSERVAFNGLVIERQLGFVSKKAR
jgi:hypothetical protein